MLTLDRINTEEDVRQIRLPESDKLDYKTALGESKDLCMDVSALANTVGGILIVGVKENGGVPKAWPGIEIPEGDPDKFKLKIDDIICNGVTPHPHVRIKPIPFEKKRSKWFVVLEVLYGNDPPYMVTIGGVYRHYHRHDGRNFPMSPNEIRSIFENKKSREVTSKEQLNAVLADFIKPGECHIYWVSIPLNPPGLILPIDEPEIQLLMDDFALKLMGGWDYKEPGMDYYEYMRSGGAKFRFYEKGCVAHRKQVAYWSHFEECVISSIEYRNDTLNFLKSLITAYSGKYDFVPIRVFTGTLNASKAFIVNPGDPIGATYLPRVTKDFNTEAAFYLSEIHDDSTTATDKLLKRIYRRFRTRI